MAPQERQSFDASVLIQMVGGTEVRGTLHLPPGIRTMDLLNREAESFLAITGASLHRGDIIDRVPFIALNKAHVVSLRELSAPE